MPTRFVRDEQDRKMLLRLLESHDIPMTVQVTKGIKRSLAQNRLINKWYVEIADQLGELPIDVRCRCKLELGVPILRAEDDEFCEAYDKYVKRLSYQAKLEIMKWWPVTSIMKTPQCKKYLDAMHIRYSGEGVVLTIPEDDYSAPMSSQGAAAGDGVSPLRPSPAPNSYKEMRNG